jgi:hypothetical protein
MNNTYEKSVQIVELPGWDEDTPFTAKLRRPSLLALAAEGVIPNELLSCAKKLFSEGDSESMRLDELGRLLLIIAEHALCEPTCAQLTDKGVSLTDVQLGAIYSFTQAGVRALEPFRRKSPND